MSTALSRLVSSRERDGRGLHVEKKLNCENIAVVVKMCHTEIETVSMVISKAKFILLFEQLQKYSLINREFLLLSFLSFLFAYLLFF